MRYFFDTEFIEDGRTIDLISIGIVAEDGREYYAQSSQADLQKADDWVKENVLAHLEHRRVLAPCRAGHPMNAPCPWKSRGLIRSDLLAFCWPDTYGKPEFWAYYADYDWVVLCQLFGRMIDLPKGWPMYCRDLKQWADDLGGLKLPEQGKGEHHALADARWNREAWEFLQIQQRIADLSVPA